MVNHASKEPFHIFMYRDGKKFSFCFDKPYECLFVEVKLPVQGSNGQSGYDAIISFLTGQSVGEHDVKKNMDICPDIFEVLMEAAFRLGRIVQGHDHPT